MNYKIQNRIDNILRNDKMNDPQSICKILREEIKPIVENYLSLQTDLKVRFKTENKRNIFYIEIDAERIKPFGYIPY